MKKFILTITLSTVSFITLCQQNQQVVNQSNIKKVEVTLTFKNGIDDCPSYGIHGSFLNEMLAKMNGKVINEDIENHKTTIEFIIEDGKDIKTELLNYAEKNHYPASHVFDIEIIN